MTQPPDDAALVARLKALLTRRRDAGEAYDRLLAEVQDEPLEEDEDDDRGLRRAHNAVMVASSLLSHASVNALPGLLDALEAKDRRIADLEAELRLIADAEFVDVMCDPGWAIRISRAALEPSDKGVGR